MTTAISIEGVSKRFRLNQDRQSSLKERVVHLGRKKRGHKDFWALRDIDLEIEEGETVGLLGHNGSGKSTLLKCVGGILSPTEGEIRVRGRMASLLELGAGFHPDLTGRENVFLNASILGHGQARHRAALRRHRRLRRARAVHRRAGEALLVGHVRAPRLRRRHQRRARRAPRRRGARRSGDEAFQRKCLERVRGFQRGRPHDRLRDPRRRPRAPDLRPRSWCSTTARTGHRRRARPTAILMFREQLLGEHLDEDHVLEHGHRITSTSASRRSTCAGPARTTATLRSDPASPCRSPCATSATSPMRRRRLRPQVRDSADIVVYGCNSDVLGQPIDRSKATGWVTFEIPACRVVDGTYLIDVGVHTPRRRHGVRLRARGRRVHRGRRHRRGRHRRPPPPRSPWAALTS